MSLDNCRNLLIYNAGQNLHYGQFNSLARTDLLDLIRRSSINC